MPNEDQRHFMRRDDDRELLVDHGVRLGRLERDVTQLADHVERELDNLDLKFPTFDRVAKDYVPRAEHHQTIGDRRADTLVKVAIASLLFTPALSAIAERLLK